MKKEVLSFRAVFLDRVYKSLMKRFIAGEFDQGIELFLQGKSIIIDMKFSFDGSKLSEFTKATIAALPTKEGIKRFNEAITELEHKPVSLTDEIKKKK
jgi:ABC-type microcin C transport system permease subunit YejB